VTSAAYILDDFDGLMILTARLAAPCKQEQKVHLFGSG
jgi:hypothetical protein